MFNLSVIARSWLTKLTLPIARQARASSTPHFKRAWLRATIFGLAALTFVFASRTTWAQASYSAPPPPVYSRVDSNGVDLLTGALNRAGGSVSIGPSQGGGLSFSFLETAPYGSGAPFGVINNNGSAAGSTFYVSIGRSTEKFTSNGQLIAGQPMTFTPAQGQGSTLNLSGSYFTYTASDGTVAVFAGWLVSNAPRQATSGVIISLTRPSGEKLSYTYKAYEFCAVYYGGQCMFLAKIQRPTSISSNMG